MMRILFCRLFKGKDLDAVCMAINAKVVQMQAGPEMNALMAWTWHLSLKLIYLLAQVCACVCVCVCVRESETPAQL